MADRARILPNFEVVSTLVALVTPEVDLVVILLHKLKTEGLVPALWEYVERDLAANAVPQTHICELLLEDRDKVAPYVVLLIVGLEVIALFAGARPAHWRNIEHSSASLHMDGGLNRNVELVDVIEAELNHVVDPVFSQVVLQRLLFD